VDFSDSGALLQAAQSARVCLNPPSVVLLNDEDVSGLIRQYDSTASAFEGCNKPLDVHLRTPEVSRSTVPVANHPDIRAVLVEQQRAMALACRCLSTTAPPSSFHSLSQSHHGRPRCTAPRPPPLLCAVTHALQQIASVVFPDAQVLITSSRSSNLCPHSLQTSTHAPRHSYQHLFPRSKSF
jgi:hypothetical protein